jgi:allantoinase
LVASDHSPCPPAMKCRQTGDFLGAWGGISSLQFSLSIMWTQASRRGYSIQNLTQWMSRKPAQLAGLTGRKGAIAPGYDADLVIWKPRGRQTCLSSAIHHRHELTPYNGHVLDGVVESTFLRGEKIYDNGRFASGPRGEPLCRADI